MNLTLLFLSTSGGELIIVFVLALLLFGAKKLPEVARGLGKGIREIKNATGEIQSEITKGMSDDIKDIKKIRDDMNITKKS